MLLITAKILDLSNVEIINVRFDNNNEVVIGVKSTKQEINCRQCGRITEPYGTGKNIRLRHLSINIY